MKPMEKYDVVSIGGGIAGSIAARLAAEGGLNSLLVERAKTPRDKSPKSRPTTPKAQCSAHFPLTDSIADTSKT